MTRAEIAAILAENKRLRAALAKEMELTAKAFAPAQPPAPNQPGK